MSNDGKILEVNMLGIIWHTEDMNTRKRTAQALLASVFYDEAYRDILKSVTKDIQGVTVYPANIKVAKRQ